MPGSEDLILLAEGDYSVCLDLEKSFPSDYACRAVSYHIQQAIEKLLKALILLCGYQPEFTHNIFTLSKRCSELGIELPDELDDIADSLTLWEAISRYDTDISFTEAKYAKAKRAYLGLHEIIAKETAGITEIGETDRTR